MNKIFNECCIKGLSKLEDEIIDLCITSPPYDDLREYNQSSIWNFQIFTEVAEQLWRVCKKGAVVVWIVGDSVVKGEETLSSFRQATYFTELGFKLHDTMIYEKNGASFPARRNGNRYSQIFEYMFVFSKKTKPKTVNLICDKANRWAGYINFGKATYRDKNGDLVERKQKTVPEFSPRNNIWKYNTGKNYTTKDDYAFEHPAMFPEKLAEDHILTWSNEGDLVLDPFMGAGTTGKMAILNSREFIGFEIDSAYFEISQRRLKAAIAQSKEDICPNCFSNKVVKNGTRKGKQRFRCRNCNCQFINTYSSRGYSEKVKKHCLKLYRDGMGFREIERSTGVSHNSVINWVRQSSTNCAKSH